MGNGRFQGIPQREEVHSFYRSQTIGKDGTPSLKNHEPVTSNTIGTRFCDSIQKGGDHACRLSIKTTFHKQWQNCGNHWMFWPISAWSWCTSKSWQKFTAYEPFPGERTMVWQSTQIWNELFTKSGTQIIPRCQQHSLDQARLLQVSKKCSVPPRKIQNTGFVWGT